MALDFPSAPTVGQQYLNWTWNGTAWVVTAGQPVPFYNNSGRNFLDNALFNVQQRGQGPWSAQAAYTADRWQLAVNTDTISMTIIALTDAQRTQIGDEAAQYGFQNVFTGSNAAGAYSEIAQKIEKVRRLGGKTITVSFFAVATAALSLGVSIDQIFGTGGSPSATVNGNGVAVPITTTFARYQVTFNVPSTSGATLGTNGDDYTQVNFWYSSGANLASRAGIGVQSGTVVLWGVQVEVNSVATPLEKLVPEVDLARCQRFYQSLGSFGMWGVATVGGQTVSMYVTYPVMMRGTPTVVNGFSSFTNVQGGTQNIQPNTAGAYLSYLSNAAGDTNAQVSGPAFNLSADL